MARMAYAATEASPAAAIIELALVPLEDEVGEGWSIDHEPLQGPGWHDSSWMLKRGLEVTEILPAEPVPPEWQWHWWVAAGTPA